ncbi:MAG TPA: DPP IV N-terminal domain-containing protein [Gemmatimonadaceae bacterium]|nr:DPP IV N-terminal domain-containing protein [Gemmatimonadaceae bacterium]
MRLSSLALALCASGPLLAQEPQRTLTAADYARAERYLTRNIIPLITGGAVRATWLPDGRFWYRRTTESGRQFIVVDPSRRTRTATLDSATLMPPSGDVPRNAHVSPDGKRAAFIRDWNLWLRDLTTGQERQLTTDGVKDFGYATDNAGWIRSDRAILLWSPDSRRIATFQQDDRRVGEMYLVSTAVGHPRLDAWKYPLPGDSVVSMIHRVIIDIDAGRLVRLQMPPDFHRSTVCDHIVCDGARLADAQWSPDGLRLAFVSSSRDHKVAQLRVADASSGVVRDVLEERVATYFESGSDRENWYVSWSSNEVLWFSERDDWGHLYLYDLTNGRLKNRITSGEGNVSEVLRVDEKARTILFVGVGRERGRDPYFRHVYRVGFDGRNARLLTPEDADHDVTLSPSGAHFVDTWSRPDVPATSVLRDANGRIVVELEKTDISRLVATGWTPPIPFTVKARDGTTDLYGLMYRPSSFDSTRRYPIIVHHYPGPQGGSVGSRSFHALRGDTRSLAELGFIVIQLDGMGLPGRTKSFHDAYYGNMGDNGLPDQVTGVRQLAQRHRWIDIDRVGIYGHSGGGYSSADAILRYPDFFKVAVSQAGNHDNRIYEDDWGEKWQGLLERRPNGTTNYDNQANQLLAQNLKGKLLIAWGTMDDNVPPNNSLVLVNELIRHNKDFDVIPFPNRRHGFGNEPYMMRRRWDYFVRHLLGVEPPKEFEFTRVQAP